MPKYKLPYKKRNSSKMVRRRAIIKCHVRGGVYSTVDAINYPDYKKEMDIQFEKISDVASKFLKVFNTPQKMFSGMTPKDYLHRLNNVPSRVSPEQQEINAKYVHTKIDKIIRKMK